MEPWSLAVPDWRERIAAATLGAPDRDAISFVTVNAQDHDLAGFKKDLLGALKGTPPARAACTLMM